MTTAAGASLQDVIRQVFAAHSFSTPVSIGDETWRASLRSGLAAAVALAARAGGLDVPDEARTAMRWAAMHHLRTLSDLSEIAQALNAAKVRWLVFKGPVLADVVYRQPGLRVYGDLDLLVHPHDVAAALSALAGAGAELLDKNWKHIRRTEQSEISLSARRGTAIDLHWHMISNPETRRAIGLPVAALLDRAVTVSLRNTTVPTLDPVDTVCYLALHAALSGGHQLRWLIDIQQAIRWAAPAPAELQERARELGCALVLQVMLARVARRVDPQVGAYRMRSGSAGFWVALCSLIDRVVPLDPEPSHYSGRAAYASTRTTLRLSVLAGLRAGWRALSAGKGRRELLVDASILRLDAGHEDDRSEWLAIARSHA